MPNWKKVLVSGSNAHLNHVTVSGNISGSSTSTGSFGRLFTDSHADIQGQLFIQPQNNTNSATTAEEMVIYGASSEAGIAIVANADANSYYTSYIKARYDGAEGFYIKGPSGDKFLSYGHTGTNTRIGVSDTTGTLHLRAQMISGSATSHLTMGQISSSGDVVADGDVVAYNSSDMRLKNNLQVIEGALDKIDGLNGYEFDWNDKSPGWARQRGHDVGVVAQEVQKIHPEIVEERKNGYLGVDYKRLVPLLIQSVKELKQEVEELKKKV